eukprot:1724626-Rhodomonas_salina.1
MLSHVPRKPAFLFIVVLFSTFFTSTDCQKAVTSFSPTSGVANIGTTLTVVGTSLSTADQVALVDVTVTLAIGNTTGSQTVSGCLALNSLATAVFSGNLFTVNDEGTEGIVTVQVRTAKTYSVCVNLFPANTWVSAAQTGNQDTYVVLKPTITRAAMASGGTSIKALMNRQFQLIITGSGLVVDSTAINLKWNRGSGSCLNGTSVTGGDTRRLDTANNAGTSGQLRLLPGRLQCGSRC